MGVVAQFFAQTFGFVPTVLAMFGGVLLLGLCYRDGRAIIGGVAFLAAIALGGLFLIVKTVQWMASV